MFKSLKIRTKLISTYLGISIVALLIGILGYNGTKTLRDSQRDILNNRFAGVLNLQSIKQSQEEVMIGERGLIIKQMMTKELRQAQYDFIDAAIEEAQAAFENFETLNHSEAMQKGWASFTKQWDNWLEGDQAVLDLAKERDRLISSGLKDTDSTIIKLDEEIFDAALTSREISLALLDTATAMIDRATNESQTLYEESEATTSRSLTFLIILVFAAFVISLSSGIVIARNIQSIINSLIKQVKTLAFSISDGKLAARANTEETHFEFREISVGFNNVLEAIIKPLQMAAGYIENFGKGNIPGKITEEYKGDYNDIKNSINDCIDGMQGLVESNRVLQKMAVNDYTLSVHGEYEGVYSDVCTAVNLVQERILHVIAICQRIAKGDLSDRSDMIAIGKRSENDTLLPAMLQMANAINDLILDTNGLANAATEGKLSTRADVSKHQGEYANVIQGVNNTLDAVVGPLTIAADNISRISVGDMPSVITEKFNGDFNIIINNINVLIGALNEIIEKAKLVAGGDLTVDLKKRSENDELMQSLTEMVKATANIIGEFQTAANNISASSQQMSSTSQEMSQGASEQASSAEEVSSSMEEMAANIQQNTENAQQTEKIALNAADGITKVNDASDQTLQYMKDIADKVSIIGEIARQTNILALNAAVEAARAGEHGKGFAVVAAEVRKLAERSQVSAVEIDSLTKNSVIATEDSGKLLSAIAPEISKTAKLVQEIAAASMEQNSGADQVNNAIQQLNQVTQQNAAASEEMATSSEELASQAQQLMEMISFFKLESTDSGKKSFISNKDSGRSAHHTNISHVDKSKQKHSEPSKPTGKGIHLDMGKDNLDAGYEKF